jgi:hypothetical protein
LHRRGASEIFPNFHGFLIFREHEESYAASGKLDQKASFCRDPLNYWLSSSPCFVSYKLVAISGGLFIILQSMKNHIEIF